MKVLYLGCFCEPTISTFIKECTKGVITVSATTFQKALLAGCNECGIRPDYIVNVPDIGSFPFRCNNLFFSKSKFNSVNSNLIKSDIKVRFFYSNLQPFDSEFYDDIRSYLQKS